MTELIFLKQLRLNILGKHDLDSLESPDLETTNVVTFFKLWKFVLEKI